MGTRLLKRLTIRARLTVVYGGLLLLAGIVLLGSTYVLVASRLPRVATSPPEGIRIEEPLPGGVPGEQTRLRAIVGQFGQDIRDSALDSLLTQGAVALVLVTAVATGFGWLIAGRALQPLHQITDTARRIAGSDGAGRGLHERIALSGPDDEVKELADTFDLMLERLNQSFDGQRRFVANASHELRTPLAINRSLVELAITRPGASAELRTLGETLLAVNERHERLIDGLLTLADSENEITDRTPVDLAEMAGFVADQFHTAASRSGVEIVRQLKPAPTRGDAVLLERLTANLVENAVRHNVADSGWLCVRTEVIQGLAMLTVTNTGPVVPTYELETLFQPFRRLGTERVDGRANGRKADRAGSRRGFGLGLSIVRAVARAHGGEVTAQPRAGGGLTVSVTLPCLTPVTTPAPKPVMTAT
ncbi:MAG TPA: HAMP domain-containing sensor histidine kinase [Pilimelia sp.]|nr:HAMP domain-containing sensor histidine kinase [Pilimelia sp.]